MRVSTIAVVASAFSFAAGTASAEGLFNLQPAPSGFYLSTFGGGSFLNDAEFTGVSNPEAGVPGPTGVAGVPLTVDTEFSSSYTVGGALGYQLPFTYFGVFHPRLEVEVSYLENTVAGGSFNGGAQNFSGDQETLFLYLNNYSDIKLSPDQRFVPYVGGGLGVGFVDSKILYFPASAGAPTFGVIGDDAAFAGHVAAGASYALDGGLELYSEGRYFRIQNVDLERRFIGGGADLFNGDVEDDIEGFTVTGGLRWRF